MAARVEPAEAAETVGARLLALLRAAPGLAAIAVMAVAGMGIAAYLTFEHYANQEPFCTTVGPINCASVLKSPYSVVPGTSIPITIPGLLWFLVSGGLAMVGLVALWRSRPEPDRLRAAQLAWSAAGMVFVLYLVWAEIVKVRSICAWCTVVHLLTLATFLIALSRWQQSSNPQPARASRIERAEEPRPAGRVAARRMALPAHARRAIPAAGRRGGTRSGRRR